MLLEELYKLVLVSVVDEQKMKWLKIWNSIAPCNLGRRISLNELLVTKRLMPSSTRLLIGFKWFAYPIVCYLDFALSNHHSMVTSFSNLQFAHATNELEDMKKDYMENCQFQRVLRILGPMWKIGGEYCVGIVSLGSSSLM